MVLQVAPLRVGSSRLDCALDRNELLRLGFVQDRVLSLFNLLSTRPVQLEHPNVLLRTFPSPTVPQNHGDSHTVLALGARGPRFKSARPDQPPYY